MDCKSTQKDLHINATYIVLSGEERHSYMCKMCNRKRAYKWYHASDKNKLKRRLANLKYLAKNKQK